MIMKMRGKNPLNIELMILSELYEARLLLHYLLTRNCAVRRFLVHFCCLKTRRRVHNLKLILTPAHTYANNDIVSISAHVFNK